MTRLDHGRPQAALATSSVILLAAIFPLATVSMAGWNDLSFTRLGHFGGPTSAVESLGQYLYYNQDTDLLVYDTLARKELARLPLPDTIQKIKATESKLYVACGRAGLVVISLADPTHPRVLGSRSLNGYVDDLCLREPYVFVVAANAAVYLVDVQEPSRPRVVRTVVSDYYVEDVAADAGHLYVSDGINGIAIFDILSIESPRLLRTVDNVRQNGPLLVNGGYLYSSFLDGGLAAYDLSDPASPREVSVIHIGGRGSDLDMAGATLFVSNRSGGIMAVDVSNPARPVVAGRLSVNAYDACPSGGSLYCAAWFSGALRLDIRDPRSITVQGRRQTLGVPRSIRVEGTRAYVADYHNGLRVLDIRDPGAIKIQGALDLPGPILRAAMTSTHAFLASGPNGLQVVSLGARPHQIGKYAPGGCYSCALVDSTTLVVARGNAGIEILDVSNPARPRLLSRIQPSGWVDALAVRRPMVYAGNGSDLFTIDITKRDQPVLRQELTRAGTLGLTTQTHFLFTTGDRTFSAFDIMSAATVVPLASIDLSPPQYHTSVSVSGARAYIASRYSGLRAFDLTDRRHPTLFGSLVTGGDVSLAAWGKPYLLLGDGQSGGIILYSITGSL
ncbi:MAG: hypothetical protein AB1714_29770 [Acidobacteriota bacterium]